ncbi:MAG: hypothetical protein ACJA0N_000130 [Pseudohongiellaceae bacterium]|jgi:hypothetical protein
MNRNECSSSIGIGVQHGPEYANGLFKEVFCVVTISVTLYSGHTIQFQFFTIELHLFFKVCVTVLELLIAQL